MIYLKSLFAGLAAVVIVVFATVVTIIISLIVASRNLPPDQAIGWDPVSFFRGSHPLWIVLALAFVIGFAWEYRRALPLH